MNLTKYFLLCMFLFSSPFLINHLFDYMPTIVISPSSLHSNDFDQPEIAVVHCDEPFRPSACLRLSGTLYWVWAMTMTLCVVSSVATVFYAGVSCWKKHHLNPSWHWLLPFSSLTCVVLGNALGSDMAYRVMNDFAETVLVPDDWMQGLNFTTYYIERSSFCVFCCGISCFIVSNMMRTCVQSSQKGTTQKNDVV